MALTIQAQPAATTYYPVGNPIEFLVSSTNSAQPNFKVITKVYYDPSGANTLLCTLKYDIIPSTTQILADIAAQCQSKMAIDITNLRTSVTGLKNETTQLHNFNVTFQEYYGSVPVASGSTSTSNTFLAYNGSLKNMDWVDGETAYYRINSAAGADVYTGRLCTGWDNWVDIAHSTVVATPADYFNGQYNVRKINYNQLCQLMFLWQGTSGTNKAVTLYYHSAAFVSSLFSGTISLSSNTCPTSLNFGTAAIIAGGGGSLGSLNSTGKYLSLAVKNNTYQLSAVYLFEIDWSPCSKYDSYEIHWLNRFGGLDSWVFDRRSYHRTEIERSSYNPTSLPISGSSIVHNSYDVKGKNFAVMTKEKYVCNSNNLKAWELSGLEDLISSPSVYWNSPDYGFVNIVIDNPNVFEHKTRIDKVFNLSFGFEIDNQDIRQLP